jgi:hypothetical protein
MRAQRGSDKLTRTINPWATSSRIICKGNTFISTKADSAAVVFSASAQPYLNFNYLTSLTDFTDAANMYNFVHIKSISLEITRVVDEATITSALSGAAIYINQYPSIINESPSLDLISSNDSTYKIDTLTFEKQVLHLPIRDVQFATIAGLDMSVISTGKMMEVPLVDLIRGEMALASDNTNVAVAGQKLFSVLVRYHCTFYYRA